MMAEPTAKPRITFDLCMEYARKIAAAAPDDVRIPEPKGAPAHALPLLHFVHQDPDVRRTGIRAYGKRFLYRTQENHWAAIDALIEDGQIIGVTLHPSRIAEQWNDSLRNLRRRKSEYTDFSKPVFLKDPEHNLHFVSFASPGRRQPRRHIHLLSGLSPRPRAKLLTSFDVEATCKDLRVGLAFHTQRKQLSAPAR